MTIKFNHFDVIKTNILIETGTYEGEFVESQKGNYDTIHTIEIVPEFYSRCVEKFKDDDNIICHLGDSPEILTKVLNEIDEPVTFWLDAHYQGGKQPDSTRKPLIDELVAIGQHHIKNHFIMVDDVREFHKYGTTKEHIITLLKMINPNYKIEFRRGHIENDVIIAYEVQK